MYSLRKLAVVAVLGGAAFAPTSFAGTPVDCNASPVETAGQGRTTDSVGGVCVEGLGYIEAGTDGSGQVYVVAESDQLGYVGVSNYENGAKSNCDPTDPRRQRGRHRHQLRWLRRHQRQRRADRPPDRLRRRHRRVVQLEPRRLPRRRRGRGRPDRGHP